MTENEFVYVYFGTLKAPPKPHPDEIDDIAFLPFDEIRRRLKREPESFAIWFRHYFEHHHADIGRLAKAASPLAAM